MEEVTERQGLLASLEARAEVLRSAIDTDMAEFVLMIQKIHDQELWRETHRSWTAYLLDRWKVSRATGWRWLDQGRGLLELGEGSENKTAGEVDPPRDIGSAPSAKPKPESQRSRARARADKAGQIIDMPLARDETDPEAPTRGRDLAAPYNVDELGVLVAQLGQQSPGWGAKVPSESLVRLLTAVAVETNAVTREKGVRRRLVVEPIRKPEQEGGPPNDAECQHPKGSRRVLSFGSWCDACDTRVR